MWLYPYLTYLSYLTIFCILAVFVRMTFNPDSRSKLLSTLLSVEVVLAVHVLRIRFVGHLTIRTEETASGKPAR
jgi:L-asparagine transporter-like permease